MFQCGSSDQYTNTGVMETFYEAVWGNSSAIPITAFDVDVPQPQFYIDPQYRDIADEPLVEESLAEEPTAEEPHTSQFHLTGISDKVQSKQFLKFQPQTERKLHPVSSSFILREEYIRIEKLLEEAVSLRWAEIAEGKEGVRLDYKVSGQPGCGTYLTSYVSHHNC